MLECWYEIWAANLVTTSNLALNKAWLARLPNIQTGDDFITNKSLRYAMTLHQFPRTRATWVACKNKDLVLLKRMVQLRLPLNLSAAIEFGNLDLILYVQSKLQFRDAHYRYAAKLGRKDLLVHFVQQGQRCAAIVYGAAEHSKEMLEFALELLPEHKVTTADLTVAAALSDAVVYLQQNGLWQMLPRTHAEEFMINMVKSRRLDYIERVLTHNVFRPWNLSWEAAAQGFPVLQLVSKFVQPDSSTMFSAARAGDRESVLWLLSRCDASEAWRGAAEHGLEMLKFVSQLCLPQAKKRFFEQPTTADYETILWLERCFPEKLNYERILELSLDRYQPRTTLHVRTKTRLEADHFVAAMATNNLVQLEWLAKTNPDQENLLWALLQERCSIEIWKLAHQYELYHIYQPHELNWLPEDDLADNKYPIDMNVKKWLVRTKQATWDQLK